MLLPGNQLPQAQYSAEVAVDDLDVGMLAHVEALNAATDYTVLAAPHISALQAVLHGERSRYKLAFENAVLLFDHGCLMGRVFFEGRFYALPPIALDDQGRACLRALPIAQRPALAEFCKLPKGILLFYFTLLKQAFGGATLYSQWIDLKTERTSDSPIPAVLRPWLQAVGWPYASGTVSGCSVL